MIGGRVNGRPAAPCKSVSNACRCESSNRASGLKNGLPRGGRRFNVPLLFPPAPPPETFSTLPFHAMPIAVGSKALDFTLKTKTADGPSVVKYAEQTPTPKDHPNFSAVAVKSAQAK
jgi:hypothetical protein